MKVEKYKRIIKLLKEKGANFAEQYAEICEKVAKYAKHPTEEISVLVEGVYDDEKFVSKETGSNVVLTRITIKEGKKTTIFVVKDIKEGMTKNIVSEEYMLAKIKIKMGNKWLSKYEQYCYNIVGPASNALLCTDYDKPTLLGRMLGGIATDRVEEYLTGEELVSIEDKPSPNKNWHLV